MVDLRPPGDGSLFGLMVEDLDAEIARLEESGVAFERPPVDRPDWGIRVVYFRDPAGNLIELQQQIEMSD